MTNSTTRRTASYGGRRPVKSYGDDRVCETLACATKLSRYNSTSHCVLHQRQDG
ncbi:MAG: hypothetical protein IT196_13360 [Acidimicrobiales bacterium]|nr:hypothetical protein [Acidimicrobiales bacterium]